MNLFYFAVLSSFICASTLVTVHGQVSVTDSTFGINPNTQDPTFPPGLNGLSTGETVVFTALATGPSPSISRATLTLTGDALSAYEASIQSDYSQAMGSEGQYSTTTGGEIFGIAATLSGGYDDPNERPQSTATSSMASSGSNFASSIHYGVNQNLVTSFGIFTLTILIAVVIL